MRWPILLSLPCLGAAQNIVAPDTNRGAFSYFVTRPDIEAPKWNIETYNRKKLQKDSYWFVAPYAKLDQVDYPMWNGPFIYRTDGELVWSGVSLFNYVNIHDFKVSHVDGKRMLSFIQPRHPDSSGVILDETYTQYKALNMRTNISSNVNMHDFNVINDGKSALVITHHDIDLLPEELQWNRSCKPHWEGFMEIDTATNDILFEWKAQGHISLAESAASHTDRTVEDLCNNGKPWDSLHFNAIDKFEDGDYLLSAKNTDTLYKISHIDGSVVWRLGGYKSDFEFGPNARFLRQHHGRSRGQNETHTFISVFNNARQTGFLSEELRTDHTSALLLALRTDTTPMTADIVTQFDKPFWHIDFESQNLTKTRGSFDYLPNGNAFIGWVGNSHISEHSPDGEMLQQAILTRTKADTYRAYKSEWEGRPLQPPDVVAQVSRRPAKSSKRPQSDLYTSVWVSWNGATEVQTWNVMNVTMWHTASEVVSSQRSTGFETMIPLDGYVDRVIVVGIDATGEELGRSAIITTLNPTALDPENASNFALIATSAAVIAFICGIVFRRRLLSCCSRAKRIAYRPLSNVEGESLLAEADDDEDRLSPREKDLEHARYKDKSGSKR